MQYRLTTKGLEALESGDRLVGLANEAAKGGVFTTEDLSKVADFTPMESEYIVSVLSRSGYIEPAPIQGMKYEKRGANN